MPTIQESLFNPRLEASSDLCHDKKQMRHADIYVLNQCINGKLASFYLSISSPIKPDIVSKAGHMGSSAPAATEQDKLLENSKICGKFGWSCIPLVVESFGARGEKLQAPSPRMHLASLFPLYPPITSTADPTCG